MILLCLPPTFLNQDSKIRAHTTAMEKTIEELLEVGNDE